MEICKFIKFKYKFSKFKYIIHNIFSLLFIKKIKYEY